MNAYFILNNHVEIKTDLTWTAVLGSIAIMKRDLQMTLNETSERGGTLCLVKEEVTEESFHISFNGFSEMVIGAKDELGFVYALLYLSKEYLGIQPFWFWNDQKFVKKENVKIPLKDYSSTTAQVHFRGWFINDEVLIDQWQVKGSSQLPWEMAFEALLRCGGNMVIPGTDKNSKKYRKLASDMGLWITHHHAEPLGAEMFARVYPELTPSFDRHQDLFYDLWEKGIEEQKGMKMIWNLGFRGQGDYPFWLNDPKYDTPEARGQVISAIIKLQYDLLCSKVENPICCTNLYGETMELFKDGLLDFSSDIIKIWADNGYGKMVSRRQENHNPRIYALPDPDAGKSKEEHHGLYYHVSFYDLQAANHLTMLPNSIDFVNRELQFAFSQGADDFLIVNCSNIKPHVYYLDAIRKIWKQGFTDTEAHGYDYIRDYFSQNDQKELSPDLIEKIKECFDEYALCTIKFGPHEDEHAGEQFYNYTTRILASHWFKGEYIKCVQELLWANAPIEFSEQVRWYKGLCEGGREKFEKLYQKCLKVARSLQESEKQLFEDSILLQVKLHLNCLEGAMAFCLGFEQFRLEQYQEAFFSIGNAIEKYHEADWTMKQAEHDQWIDFYANDCLCDIKQTAYFLRNIMGYIRNIGEGPHFYNWQREFLYPPEDRRVVLITNMENHLTDEELYQCMKEKMKLYE